MGVKKKAGTGFTIFRSCMLIVMGLGLLFTEKTRPMLFNVMAMTWLSMGILLLTKHWKDKDHPLLRAMGVMGVITGFLVLLSNFVSIAPDILVYSVLGIVIFINGIMHVFIRVKIGFRTLSIMFGVIECIIGILIVVLAVSDLEIVREGLLAFVWVFALGTGISTLVGLWISHRKAKKRSAAKKGTEEK